VAGMSRDIDSHRILARKYAGNYFEGTGVE
jgi:hypothetical protein